MRNIIEPLSSRFDTRVFAHLFIQDEIRNPRSGEFGKLPTDVEIVPEQVLMQEVPEPCLELWGLEELKNYGDSWDDEFVSLRNLVCQLHSLRSAMMLSRDFKADCTLFVRPDLWYYDSLAPYVERLLSGSRELIMLPNWQSFSGENDRFAIAKGAATVEAYAGRITRAREYCGIGDRPLHSEGLVKFALKDFRLARISTRAARVRFNGDVVKENFNLGWVEDSHWRLSRSGYHPQVRRAGHIVLGSIQRLHDLTTGVRPLPQSPTGGLLLAYP